MAATLFGATMQRNASRRLAFTLPEVMVAAAMSLVIMAILAVAFQKGIDAFRTLRAVGQMQDRLKSAENILKRDLASEHFGGIHRQGFSGPYVRDQRMDLVGWMPPEEGFFTVTQASDSVPEGTDGDVDSSRATNHSLQFTIKLTGKREEDYFTAQAPGNVAALSPSDFARTGQLVSRWGEVSYFLVANGDSTTGPAPQPLFSLYRRQRVIAASSSGATTAADEASYPELSVSGGQLNSPSTIVQRGKRSPLSKDTGSGAWHPSRLQDAFEGDDILLTDVISFEVKANWSSGAASLPAEGLPSGFDWPFAVFPASPRNATFNANRRTFDTWSSTDGNGIDWNDLTSINASSANRPPLRIRVNSLQIRIRVWDKATESARQITIVQDV